MLESDVWQGTLQVDITCTPCTPSLQRGFLLGSVRPVGRGEHDLPAKILVGLQLVQNFDDLSKGLGSHNGLDDSLTNGAYGQFDEIGGPQWPDEIRTWARSSRDALQSSMVPYTDDLTVVRDSTKLQR